MKKKEIGLLRDIELFSSLSDDELREVSDRIMIKRFGKNQVILNEEDTNEFMYVILLGKVKAVQTTEEGKEVILAMHDERDFFGEVSLIDRKTSPAAVVATEDSVIGIISRRDFFALLSGQKKVLDKLLLLFCASLRSCWSLIQVLSQKTAPGRIKMLFLGLPHMHAGDTQEGPVLQTRLTHQNIADMAGLTRETVTKVLDRWKRDGEITVLANKYIRLNPRFFRDKLM